MILESLTKLAQSENLLANPDYEPKPVAWILAVSDGGRFTGAIHTVGEPEKGKKPRAKVLEIPRRRGRTSGAAADFLVDKSEYVMGVHPEGTRSEEELAERLGLFRESVAAANEGAPCAGLAAVLAFLDDVGERQKAIAQVSSDGYVSNDLFAFEYRGGFVHDVPAVREYFSKMRRAAPVDSMQCLICGARTTPIRKHPLVKVRGGSTSGVAIVSFNADAFESFGLSGSENAPVCMNCADGYTTALTRLMSDRYPDPRRPGLTLPKRYVQLSPDTTAVYWADKETEVLHLLDYLESPRVESVGEMLKAPWKGAGPPDVSNRFYCLVISGGQGRANLRGMHTGTVEQLERSMRAYFASIDVGSGRVYSLRRLLESLVLQGKVGNLPAGMPAEVFLAIVFERQFPRMLLARAVGRCRVEQEVKPERAAVLRAWMNRNSNEEVSVALDTENTNAGYRLGRLMAVLERVQARAQNNPNATIVDRFYGAASTRPGTVFPRLVALAQHHLAKLHRGEEIGFQKRLGEVMEGIADFPAVLTLEDQGRFALGYYHQRQEFFKKAAVGAEVQSDEENKEEL